MKKKISHKQLGTGTVLNETDLYYLVFWDVSPHFDYNTGVNPCIISKKEERDYEITFNA